MTISSSTRIAGPFTSGTALPFTFKVFAASDLQVVRLNTTTGVETTLTLTTDYTVTLNGNQNTNPGGTVNLVVAASATSTVTITSAIANLQPTDLTNQGGFYPDVITDSLDRATIQIQQMAEDVGRSLKGPISDGTLNMELPTAAQRASRYLVFDASGQPITSAGSGTDTALRTDLANNSVALAGSSLVGFRQSAATSVARTVLTKLRETSSVKDFGAVGDGVTDDTAAFNAAQTANTPNPTFVPPGSYAISGTVTGNFATTGTVTIVGGSVNSIANYVTDLSAGVNAIINGDFRVSQRGSSFTSTSFFINNDDVYCLDRWYILSDGNDVIDVTQNTAAAPASGQYCIALDVETINKKFGIAQIIENVECGDLLGNTVTLSFFAKVSSTTKLDNVKCAIVAWSGTTDVVTSDIVSAWNVEGTNPTLIANATYENSPSNLGVTTSWKKFTVTANIDTANAANVIVFIWSDVTDTTLGDFIYVTDVKIEQGSVARPFVRPKFSDELLRCQRYFICALLNTNDWGPTMNVYAPYVSGSGVNFFQIIPYPVRMRAAPTVNIASPIVLSPGTVSFNSITSLPASMTLVYQAGAAGSAQANPNTGGGYHCLIEM